MSVTNGIVSSSPASHLNQPLSGDESVRGGQPKCTSVEDCIGTPTDQLVQHVLDGQPADLYCQTCWESFCALTPSLAGIPHSVGSWESKAGDGCIADAMAKTVWEVVNDESDDLGAMAAQSASTLEVDRRDSEKNLSSAYNAICVTILRNPSMCIAASPITSLISVP